MTRPVVLLILDGWGISDDTEWNAIHKGETPVFDRLNTEHPPVPIDASGEEVGLPAGQMGNSEVGHLNIGAGRVIMQDLQLISHSIKEGAFYSNRALLDAVHRAGEKGTALHLLGLVSDGGVHSHIDHISALLRLAKDNGLAKVFIHALTDGRDTPPDSALRYIKQLENEIKSIGVGAIATVMGRFYGMDRDKRWDRVEKAYRALVLGEGNRCDDSVTAVKESYEREVFDEFIDPCVITGADDSPRALLAPDDEVIFFNFRADRMREIVRVLTAPDFTEFDVHHRPRMGVTCMTEYHPGFTFPVAFGSEPLVNVLGEVLANNGIKQFRTAETEKYAHVTFFFNGGQEKKFEGEERRLVSSPNVRTYDLQPSMSCEDVTDGLIEAIEAGLHGMIIVNLANGDMVGHTGIWEAALKAVETIDTAVGRVITACAKVNAHLLITSDHGNIETMKENGNPMTAHTTNQAPIYYIGDNSLRLVKGGRLADIAPTILHLLGVKQPTEMTGKTLLEEQ